MRHTRRHHPHHVNESWMELCETPWDMPSNNMRPDNLIWEGFRARAVVGLRIHSTERQKPRPSNCGRALAAIGMVGSKQNGESGPDKSTLRALNNVHALRTSHDGTQQGVATFGGCSRGGAGGLATFLGVLQRRGGGPGNFSGGAQEGVGLATFGAKSCQADCPKSPSQESCQAHLSRGVAEMHGPNGPPGNFPHLAWQLLGPKVARQIAAPGLATFGAKSCQA